MPVGVATVRRVVVYMLKKNVLANVFNNLMVNCKFRAMTPELQEPERP